MDESISSVPAHSEVQQDGKQKRVKKRNSQDDSEDENSELSTQSQAQDSPTEIVPYSGSDIISRDTETADVSEKDTCHSPGHPRWWIRKDDEFFHFVIVCFAIGTILVCYYKYEEWTISVGVGLMTFAALETIGIYFSLVWRIRSVVDSFVPLFQRFKLPGFKKEN